MAEWSDAAKERAIARRFYRMDEACACVPSILEEEGCNKKRAVLPKRTLFKAVIECCTINRRIPGALKLPTIENTIVRPVDRRFLENNWSEITDRLAEDHKTYIIWEGGRRGGVRLGTLEEYIEQQEQLRGVTRGVAKKHNRRAAIIKDAGEESPFLGLMLGEPE